MSRRERRAQVASRRLPSRSGVGAPRGTVALIVGLLAYPALAEDRGAASEPVLTATEIAQALAHGPWPPPIARDASNRFASDPRAAALGQRLFFDKRLSRLGVLACADCHKPERAWADGRIRASAAVELDRNTPSLLDVGQRRWFGWSGASDTLWGASIRPILDPRELRSTPAAVRDLLIEDPGYAGAYRALTGREPGEDAPEAALVVAGKVLAAFQSSLSSPRAPFDDLRDRLAAGERAELAVRGYPSGALAGLRLFLGKAGCSGCHAGPIFASDGFHRVSGPGTVQGRRFDRGRSEGVEALSQSPYRSDGPFSDAPRAGAPTAGMPAGETFAFRVPGLRNLLATAPYFHDGSRATLAAAVAHGPAGEALSAEEITDLAAFLATLSAPSPASR